MCIRDSLLNSPLFQSQATNEEEKTNVQNNRPISLQQAIHILNTRLLQLEQMSSRPIENVATSANNLDEGKIQEYIHTVIQTHLSEYDHRFEILATEIANLKQIVMKLQSYTLDINKTMAEERIQLLSDIPNKTGVSIIELKDDLHLREDIANMQATSLIETMTSSIQDTEHVKIEFEEAELEAEVEVEVESE